MSAQSDLIMQQRLFAEHCCGNTPFTEYGRADTPSANSALSRPRKTRPATAPQHVISSGARVKPCAVEKSPGYDIKA